MFRLASQVRISQDGALLLHAHPRPPPHTSRLRSCLSRSPGQAAVTGHIPVCQFFKEAWQCAHLGPVLPLETCVRGRGAALGCSVVATAGLCSRSCASVFPSVPVPHRSSAKGPWVRVLFGLREGMLKLHQENGHCSAICNEPAWGAALAVGAIQWS